MCFGDQGNGRVYSYLGAFVRCKFSTRILLVCNSFKMFSVCFFYERLVDFLGCSPKIACKYLVFWHKYHITCASLCPSATSINIRVANRRLVNANLPVSYLLPWIWVDVSGKWGVMTGRDLCMDYIAFYESTYKSAYALYMAHCRVIREKMMSANTEM